MRRPAILAVRLRTPRLAAVCACVRPSCFHIAGNGAWILCSSVVWYSYQPTTLPPFAREFDDFYKQHRPHEAKRASRYSLPGINQYIPAVDWGMVLLTGIIRQDHFRARRCAASMTRNTPVARTIVQQQYVVYTLTVCIQRRMADSRININSKEHTFFSMNTST